MKQYIVNDLGAVSVGSLATYVTVLTSFLLTVYMVVV